MTNTLTLSLVSDETAIRLLSETAARYGNINGAQILGNLALRLHKHPDLELNKADAQIILVHGRSMMKQLNTAWLDEPRDHKIELRQTLAKLIETSEKLLFLNQ